MSFWDNVKKFTQPYADDEYDDYDDYEDEYADEYEEPAPARRAPRRAAAAPAAPAPAAKEDDAEDFGFTPAVTSSSAPAAKDFGGRVLPMNSNKQAVVLFHPTSFADTSKAADELCHHKAVIVNMENVDKAMSRRVVDFLTGCVYALEGTVKKVAQSTYLFCPRNVEVHGDLESIQAEVESYI